MGALFIILCMCLIQASASKRRPLSTGIILLFEVVFKFLEIKTIERLFPQKSQELEVRLHKELSNKTWAFEKAA